MSANLKRKHIDLSSNHPASKKQKANEKRSRGAERKLCEKSEEGPLTSKYVSFDPSEPVVPQLALWRTPEILGGEVYYIPQFVDGETANKWRAELTQLDTWYHPKLKVYGKEVSQSRSISAYSTDANLVLKYSGHVVTMNHAYPTLLVQIQKRVENLLGKTFNHVMLNRYENGREYIGKHRDIKENKMIVSLSLGAERTFIMTPSKSVGGTKIHKWILENGSLLVMKGNTQDNWKHEIPKEPKITDERISLTFRQLVAARV